ncbi:unnamed protein product [Arabidopsis halleri]
MIIADCPCRSYKITIYRQVEWFGFYQPDVPSRVTPELKLKTILLILHVLRRNSLIQEIKSKAEQNRSTGPRHMPGH